MVKRYQLESFGGENPLAADSAEKAAVQIEEYFAGERQTFDLPLDYTLMRSEFRRRVLERVSKIPFGRTVTYGDLARRENTSPRAVGSANANNPIPLIIPCHRVIGSDGNLRGYAGGLHIKEALLRHESSRLM